MFLVTSTYTELPGGTAIQDCYEKALEILNGQPMIRPASVSKDDQGRPTITRYWQDLQMAETWRTWVTETYNPIESVIIEVPDESFPV